MSKPIIPERTRLLGDPLSSDSEDEAPPSKPRGGGGGGGGGAPSNDKVNRVKGQVAEVVAVMQTNVEKVLQRGERLEELQDKSADLADMSLRFKSRSRQLRRSLWWNNVKVKVLIVGIVLFVIALIALILYFTFR